MATVVVHAALPSVRLGIANMLADHGHTLVADADAPDSSVWVVDSPDERTLVSLAVRRYTDVPRAAVALVEEAGVAAALAAAGLRGWACLGRDASAEDLDLAVRAADAGLVLLDLPTASAAVQPGSPAHARPAPTDMLTPRELQVLQHVAQGLPNKGIGRALGITENTVKFHVASLSAKLGAASRTEAVTLGARSGLIVL